MLDRLCCWKFLNVRGVVISDVVDYHVAIATSIKYVQASFPLAT